MSEERKMSVDELVDMIGGLSAIELVSLSKKLEDKFGVQPMMAQVASVGGMAAGEQPAPSKEEKTSFDVILTNHGANKIQVIKEVRAITSLGLKEAKDLVESLPKLVKEKATKEEAEEIKKKLEAVGAAIELK